MAIAPWRAALQPASFNGVQFHVPVDMKAGGRRLVVHEFPKSDTPYTEDMGRRARHFTVHAYVIQCAFNGFDYEPNRDALIAQLEAEGPGILVHPTMGVDTVDVGPYSVTERLAEAGGMAEFEIEFTEAGSQIATTPTKDTAASAIGAAQSAIALFQQSSDIAGLVGANP
jgi:prophage DNA circulation protein